MPFSSGLVLTISFVSQRESNPPHSENCFVPCFLFSLLPLDHLSSPQVVLVPGLYPPVKTQTLASSPQLTPFLPYSKCAASQDSHCPMAWMQRFAVVRVTDSGVGTNLSAQVGFNSTGLFMAWISKQHLREHSVCLKKHTLCRSNMMAKGWTRPCDRQRHIQKLNSSVIVSALHNWELFSLSP